ncbi:hypothetical protein [Peribacillus huizhouensis]|uniref:Spore coat protein n=1 Tax=Peribacillus huizhouensis TaxID=1501239 RepID=A0ABR6CUX7_9BACI|nr:hypothetical protein [Peribacillus huizhouensis]MBA9028810.1 hypothetical protein [Peribacillus huizhouensis]
MERQILGSYGFMGYGGYPFHYVYGGYSHNPYYTTHNPLHSYAPFISPVMFHGVPSISGFHGVHGIPGFHGVRSFGGVR